MSLELISAQPVLYSTQWRCACTPMIRHAFSRPPSRAYAKIRDLKGIQPNEAWQPVASRNCAPVGLAHAGRCMACTHDGYAQAWRTPARKMYAHTKDCVAVDFVDVGFVDIDATGNLRASWQSRWMDMGKSGVAANLRPALEQGCGKQTPSASVSFFRTNLACILNIEM